MNARTSRPQALFAALVALTLLAPGAPAQEGPKTQYPYGFRGFEMYKLDPGISELTACDADGDGLQDLLVVNNAKAKIEVLLRRKEPVPPKTKAGKKLPNDLVDDRFYERRDILTEKKVIALEAADFNGDGKADVAYYGKPEELVLAYGDGKGGFGETQSFRLEDYNESPRGLAAGDLNGDGRTDLVLLAKGYTRLYYQSAKGSLQEPAKVPHAVKGVSGILVRDLDGDGRVDLVHLAPSLPRSVRARFQAADGSLGAEVAFEISPWRELEFHDLDAAPGAELIVVQRASGILRSLKMTRKPSEAGSEVALGSPQIHAFEPSQGNKARAMAIGDVNGDGRADIVVTEPGTAQVALYLQDEKGELAGRKTFPSLSNSESLRLADLSGDGRAEVVVLSSGERAVGVCALTAEGRLPFPKMLAVPGVPKSMDTGDLNGDGRADLVVVVEKDKKRRAMLFLQKADGGLGDEPVTLELEGLKNAPDDMLIMDLDQDGRTDILLFDRYGPMRVWRATGEGAYEDYAKGRPDFRAGLVQKLARGNVAPADLDGDGKAELLVATKNFARAIRLDPKEGLTITDQANGSSPRSQIKGVVALDLDGDGKAEVVLYDKDKKVVTVLRRGEAGVFEITANLPVGDLDYQAMLAEDVNGDGLTDLLVFGKTRIAILYAKGRKSEFTGVFTIESTQRDAYLRSFAVGDLNGDGQPDLAVLDTGNRGLQVLSYHAEKGFAERLSWSAYEKKMHEERRRARPDPREVQIVDVDGDGRSDIAILVHDRLIVYPQ
ncbi:MAG: FG-GAP repeat domain-containing protein [Planctomycetota bacterium]|jgi:hypothetical protein